jgi:hypothetical protein
MLIPLATRPTISAIPQTKIRLDDERSFPPHKASVVERKAGINVWYPRGG